LVGYAGSGAEILNSYTNVEIVSTLTTVSHALLTGIGGIAGFAQSDAIKYTYAVGGINLGAVTITSAEHTLNVGGIIGYHSGSGEVEVLTHNMALNSGITYTKTGSGTLNAARIVGNDSNAGIRDSNYAYSGMIIGDAIVDEGEGLPHNDANGKSIELASLHNLDFWTDDEVGPEFCADSADTAEESTGADCDEYNNWWTNPILGELPVLHGFGEPSSANTTRGITADIGSQDSSLAPHLLAEVNIPGGCAEIDHVDYQIRCTIPTDGKVEITFQPSTNHILYNGHDTQFNYNLGVELEPLGSGNCAWVCKNLNVVIDGTNQRVGTQIRIALVGTIGIISGYDDFDIASDSPTYSPFRVINGANALLDFTHEDFIGQGEQISSKSAEVPAIEVSGATTHAVINSCINFTIANGIDDLDIFDAAIIGGRANHGSSDYAVGDITINNFCESHIAYPYTSAITNSAAALIGGGLTASTGSYTVGNITINNNSTFGLLNAGDQAHINTYGAALGGGAQIARSGSSEYHVGKIKITNTSTSAVFSSLWGAAEGAGIGGGANTYFGDGLLTEAAPVGRYVGNKYSVDDITVAGNCGLDVWHIAKICGSLIATSGYGNVNTSGAGIGGGYNHTPDSVYQVGDISITGGIDVEAYSNYVMLSSDTVREASGAGIGGGLNDSFGQYSVSNITINTSGTVTAASSAVKELTDYSTNNVRGAGIGGGAQASSCPAETAVPEQCNFVKYSVGNIDVVQGSVNAFSSLGNRGVTYGAAIGSGQQARAASAEYPLVPYTVGDIVLESPTGRVVAISDYLSPSADGSTPNIGFGSGIGTGLNVVGEGHLNLDVNPTTNPAPAVNAVQSVTIKYGNIFAKQGTSIGTADDAKSFDIYAQNVVIASGTIVPYTVVTTGNALAVQPVSLSGIPVFPTYIEDKSEADVNLPEDFDSVQELGSIMLTQSNNVPYASLQYENVGYENYEVAGISAVLWLEPGVYSSSDDVKSHVGFISQTITLSPELVAQIPQDILDSWKDGIGGVIGLFAVSIIYMLIIILFIILNTVSSYLYTLDINDYLDPFYIYVTPNNYSYSEVESSSVDGLHRIHWDAPADMVQQDFVASGSVDLNQVVIDYTPIAGVTNYVYSIASIDQGVPVWQELVDGDNITCATAETVTCTISGVEFGTYFVGVSAVDGVHAFSSFLFAYSVEVAESEPTEPDNPGSGNGSDVIAPPYLPPSFGSSGTQVEAVATDAGSMALSGITFTLWQILLVLLMLSAVGAKIYNSEQNKYWAPANLT
jgi:hypothetical protein